MSEFEIGAEGPHVLGLVVHTVTPDLPSLPVFYWVIFSRGANF